MTLYEDYGFKQLYLKADIHKRITKKCPHDIKLSEFMDMLTRDDKYINECIEKIRKEKIKKVTVTL